MLRSLVIRQFFRLVDLALLAGIVGIVFLVVKLFMTPLPPLEVGEAPSNEGAAGGNIYPLNSREVYDGLVRSGLFGFPGESYGEQSEEVPEVEPVQEDIAESELNLKLRGTIALEPGDPFASAFIENMDNQDGVRPYLLGSDVVTDVTLDSIAQREVILLNKRKQPPQRERLRMEDPEKSELAAENNAPVPASPGMPSRHSQGETPPTEARGSRVQHTKINRTSIVNEAMSNLDSLVRITPKIETDDSGDVVGITADNIGQYPLAQKLGFQDGDVLQTINNERIDSREKLMEIFQRYQNAPSFRIGILRNGQPNVLVFDVE